MGTQIPTKNDTVQIFKGKGIQPWRYRVVAPNGKIVASAEEGFLTKWNVKRAIRKRHPGYEIVEVAK